MPLQMHSINELYICNLIDTLNRGYYNSQRAFPLCYNLIDFHFVNFGLKVSSKVCFYFVWYLRFSSSTSIIKSISLLDVDSIQE